MKIKTKDWADWLKPEWKTHIIPFVCKNPNVLEVGSFEGNSALFWIEEMKPKHISCIDTFEGSIEHSSDEVKNLFETFNINTKEFQDKEIMTVYQGKSHDIMPTLEKNSFDFIYIDGSHIGSDVIEDAILAHKLIKDGGYILFDDYLANEPNEPCVYNNTVKNSKFAIDSFMMLYGDMYKVQSTPGNYQMFIKNISKVHTSIK
jgi:predicted O-methyltransferase YrrM